MSAAEIVAGACLMFSWTPEQVMAMPASRFYAVLEAGRKLDIRVKALDHVAKCDIASIALGDAEYYQNVRKAFYYRAFGEEDKLNPKRALDPTAPSTVLAVKSLFDTAARLNK